MKWFNRLIVTFFLALVLPGSAVLANTDVAPDAVLQQHAERVMAELNRNGGAIRNDINKLYDLVEREILPLVDFKSMSKLILGKHWKKATADQRSAFIAAFRNLLVNTYTKSLKQYANQNIKFFPSRTKIKDKYATVYSEFVPGNGQRNVPVIYKLRRDKSGVWKAYNLEIEGLSVVKNFRTDFNSEINANGLDALIARLEKEQAERRKEAEIQ
jgi:phospholipid transport system substrate-binding protein